MGYTGSKVRLCTNVEKHMHVGVFVGSFIMFVLVAFYTPLLRKLKYHHRRAKSFFSGRRGSQRDEDIEGGGVDAAAVGRVGIEAALDGVMAGGGDGGAAVTSAAAAAGGGAETKSERTRREIDEEGQASFSDESAGGSDSEEDGEDETPVGMMSRTKKGQGRAAIMSVISTMFGLLFWLALITTARCYDVGRSMSWTLWLGAGVVGTLGFFTTCCGYQIVLMDRTERRSKLVPPCVCASVVILGLLGTAIAFAALNGFFEFECEPGFYSASGVFTGWNGCDRCPAGAYCQGRQLPSAPCEPGEFCLDGAAVPSKCPAGKYFGAQNGGLAKCCARYNHDMCELNTDLCAWGVNPHSTFANESACMWKNWGATSLTWKTSDSACCVDCPAGKYAAAGASSCQPCPSAGKAASAAPAPTDYVCSGLVRSELGTLYTCDPADYSLGLRGGFLDYAAKSQKCDATTVHGYCDPTANVTGKPCVCVHKGEPTPEFAGPACAHTATLAALGCASGGGTKCAPDSSLRNFEIARFLYTLDVAQSDSVLVLTPTLRQDQIIRYHHVATASGGAGALDAFIGASPGLRAIRLARPDDWMNCSIGNGQNTGQLTQNAEMPVAGFSFAQIFNLRLMCRQPRLAGLCSCAGSSMVVMEINNTLSDPEPFPLSKSIFVKATRATAISTELSQLFKPQTNNIQDSLVAIQISGKKYTQNAFTSTRDWSTAGTSGGYIYHLNWHRGHRNSNNNLKLTPLSGAGTPLSVSVTLNRTLSTVASTFFAQGTETRCVSSCLCACCRAPIWLAPLTSCSPLPPRPRTSISSGALTMRWVARSALSFSPIALPRPTAPAVRSRNKRTTLAA